MPHSTHYTTSNLLSLIAGIDVMGIVGHWTIGLFVWPPPNSLQRGKRVLQSGINELINFAISVYPLIFFNFKSNKYYILYKYYNILGGVNEMCEM